MAGGGYLTDTPHPDAEGIAGDLGLDAALHRLEIRGSDRASEIQRRGCGFRDRAPAHVAVGALFDGSARRFKLQCGQAEVLKTATAGILPR